MDNLVGVFVPHIFGEDEGIVVDDGARYMPILVKGKPIGFIGDVNEKGIYVYLWTRNWNVMMDDEDRVVAIELDDDSFLSKILGEKE